MAKKRVNSSDKRRDDFVSAIEVKCQPGIGSGDSEFGEFVCQAITNSGISLEDISTAAGIPQETLSEFLAGKDVSYRTFDRIARSLGFELGARLPNESAKEESPHTQLPLKVNLRLKQIRNADICYDVTADGALLVDRIIKAHPDWFAASKNGFSKPSSTKNSLPDAIKELIETQPGKGYRIKLK